MIISIIVPVFNEEKTILQILEKINAQKNNFDLEIIIYDDFSNDGFPSPSGDDFSGEIPAPVPVPSFEDEGNFNENDFPPPPPPAPHPLHFLPPTQSFRALGGGGHDERGW
jgi:GT2 family glycosyltransferase